MDFQGRLELVKTTVDKGLADFFIRKKREAKSVDPHCLPVVDQIESLTTRGGKRTRAFLCWLGYHSVIAGQGRDDMLLSAMMALELFQSFALIHDDIIDEDTVRRGGPTVHEHFKVESLKFKVKNAKHFGESMAILAGDLALVWADEFMMEAVRVSLRAKRSNLNIREIAASPTAPRNDTGTWRLYQHMKEEVIYGQTLDVVEEYRKPGILKELIDTYKTAWYTVIRPLQIGACIAGADQAFLDRLASYGLIAGRAYQLRDDHLDGDVSQTDFEGMAQTYERDMRRVITSWRLGKTQKLLFIDYFHFALARLL